MSIERGITSERRDELDGFLQGCQLGDLHYLNVQLPIYLRKAMDLYWENPSPEHLLYAKHTCGHDGVYVVVGGAGLRERMSLRLTSGICEACLFQELGFDGVPELALFISHKQRHFARYVRYLKLLQMLHYKREDPGTYDTLKLILPPFNTDYAPLWLTKDPLWE